MDNIRVWITGAVGAVGAGISTAFGGWTSAMTTLIIFMAIDYITGIMVAGIFKRSFGFINYLVGFRLWKCCIYKVIYKHNE